MRILVSKKISFDAAHLLPDYKGKCSRLHGHHWVVEVGVSGEIGEDGMVVDFVVLKQALQPIIDNFDHHYLNNIIPNPTAENIAAYILTWLCTYQESTLPTVEFVRVWETEDSMVEVKR